MKSESIVRQMLNRHILRIDWFGILLLALGWFVILVALNGADQFGWWKAKDTVIVHDTTIAFPGEFSFVPFLIGIGLLLLFLFLAWRAHRKDTHKPMNPELPAFPQTQPDHFEAFLKTEPQLTVPSPPLILEPKKSTTFHDILALIIDPPPLVDSHTPLSQALRAHQDYESRLVAAEALLAETDQELKKMIRTVRERHESLKPVHQAASQPLPYIDSMSQLAKTDQPRHL